MADTARGPGRQTLILAAVLLGEEGLRDVDIARELGVSRRTLARWKTRDDLALALDAVRLVQLRRLWRRSQVWPDHAGPKTPDAWER